MSQRKLATTLLLLTALLSQVGCVTMYGVTENRAGSDSNVVVNYYRNRAMDLRDILTLSFTVGLQAGAKVQAGPAAVGLAFVPGGGGHGSLASEYGLRHGEVGEVYTDLFVIGLSFSEESGTNEGRSDVRGKDTTQTPAERNQGGTPANLRKAHNYTRLGVYLGFIGGLTIEANPGELVDFVLGLFTVDIYGDDIYRTNRAPASSAN